MHKMTPGIHYFDNLGSSRISWNRCVEWNMGLIDLEGQGSVRGDAIVANKLVVRSLTALLWQQVRIRFLPTPVGACSLTQSSSSNTKRCCPFVAFPYSTERLPAFGKGRTCLATTELSGSYYFSHFSSLIVPVLPVCNRTSESMERARRAFQRDQLTNVRRSALEKGVQAGPGREASASWRGEGRRGARLEVRGPCPEPRRQVALVFFCCISQLYLSPMQVVHAKT